MVQNDMSSLLLLDITALFLGRVGLFVASLLTPSGPPHFVAAFSRDKAARVEHWVLIETPCTTQ